MSRNDERVTASTDATIQLPEPPNNRTNPEVNMSVYMPPTEFVDLPSQGIFYNSSHPLYQKKFVEIKYMTSKEEDIITNKQLIKKGLVLDRLLNSVLVDKRIDVSSLLTGDKAAILMATRITGFGSEYSFKTSCEGCNTINEVKYDLNDCKPKPIVDQIYGAERTNDDSGNFIVTLGRSKATVECRLLKGIDETQMFETNEMKKQNKMMPTPNKDLFRKIILSVNGNSEPGVVNSFAENIPTTDSRELKNIYSELNPSSEMNVVYGCSNCEFYNDIEVPMTRDFLWPSAKQ